MAISTKLVAESKESRKVLLLNNSEEPIRIIGWKKAVKLLCEDKAFKPWNYESYYHIKIKDGYFDLPTALVLNKYVRIPFKQPLPSKENIVKRDNHQCQYCGVHVTISSATLDHVHPVSRGGKHTFRNVVTACRKCNGGKADRTPQEAGMKLISTPFTPTNSNLISKYIKYSGREEWKRWNFDLSED